MKKWTSAAVTDKWSAEAVPLPLEEAPPSAEEKAEGICCAGGTGSAHAHATISDPPRHRPPLLLCSGAHDTRGFVCFGVAHDCEPLI